MREDELSRCRREGHSVILLVVAALTVFEETGRREQFVAALDQIETFEKEYKNHALHTKISKMVNVYVKRLRSMIRESVRE